MIVNLTIRNFVLIDDLSLDFFAGLTVISGETGAGKSIILNAIEFIFGKKIETRVTKNSDAPAVLSILCRISCDKYAALKNALEERGIDCECEVYSDGDTFELLLKRVISPEGRSRFFINDALSNAAQLAFIGGTIIEMCGQHSSQILLNPKKHMDIIDSYANLHKEVQLMKDAFSIWKRYEGELETLKEKSLKSGSERSFLLYAYDELKMIDPLPNEEEVLSSKRATLIKFQKNKELLSGIKGGIQGAENSLRTIQQSLSKMSEPFLMYKQKIDSILIELFDVLSDMSSIIDCETCSDSELETIEQRLSLLKTVARKNCVTANELPTLLEKFKNQLADLDNLDELLLDCQNKTLLAKTSYIEYAKNVELRRLMAGNRLKECALLELKDLSMANIEIELEYEKFSESTWCENGMGRFLFLLRTSPKLEFAHIGLIASGGELSRLILAFKVAMASANLTPILVFDEVDAGLGGAIAHKVGEKLNHLPNIGNNITQVFVVTHQAQVACFAQNHFIVRKNTKCNKEVVVDVKFLSQHNDRIEEIARMISGEKVTEAARAVAINLLGQSSDPVL